MSSDEVRLIQYDRLEEMLEKQLDLQIKYYKRPPASFSRDDTVQYIKDMILAATDELHEALREVSWKPWSTSSSFNRDAYVDELVDGWHFFMNLLLVANVSADELFNRYLRKHQVNQDRYDSGYSSLTG